MIENLFFLALGIVGVIFNKGLAKFAVEYNAPFYEKVSGKKPGPGYVLFARIGYVVVGTLFCTISTLALFGVIKLK